MAASPDGAQRASMIGFLTIVEDGDGTLRGGYLIVSEQGRPLEFHFTQPVVFSKQERLLYGRQFGTLVHAEQIAKPLTDRQSVSPRAIITDRPTVLSLRTSVPAPVICVALDGLNGRAPGSMHISCHADYPNDRQAFDRLRELAPTHFDWLEPFERIQAALAEATPDIQVRLAA